MKFLASVTSAAEAREALAGGAQIIDAKDANQGGLAPLPLEIIRAIVAQVAGQVPVSATAGEGGDDLLFRCEAIAGTGVDYVKFGVLDAGFVHLQALASRVQLIPVLLVDHCRDLSLIRVAASAGCVGMMADTANKQGRGLTDCVSAVWLRAFVTQAQDVGLMVGLAGKLRLEDVPLLAAMGPDLLGFRSALCSGHRGGALDQARVVQLREAIANSAQKTTYSL
jgi:uncharacterized protein (UPF0264 family)